jgi:hypothetical protein
MKKLIFGAGPPCAKTTPIDANANEASTNPILDELIGFSFSFSIVFDYVPAVFSVSVAIGTRRPF